VPVVSCRRRGPAIDLVPPEPVEHAAILPRVSRSFCGCQDSADSVCRISPPFEPSAVPAGATDYEVCRISKTTSSSGISSPRSTA
jgi:hypothetical protein